jgi:hypothetical protein
MRPHRYAATVSWWTERKPIRPTIKAAATRRNRSTEERSKAHNGKGVLQLQNARSVLRGGSAKQRGATAADSSTQGSNGSSSHSRKQNVPASVRQQEPGQSVPDPLETIYLWITCSE